MPARGGGDPTSYGGCHGSHHGIYPPGARDPPVRVAPALPRPPLLSVVRVAFAVNGPAAGAGSGPAGRSPSRLRPRLFRVQRARADGSSSRTRRRDTLRITARRTTMSIADEARPQEDIVGTVLMLRVKNTGAVTTTE